MLSLSVIYKAELALDCLRILALSLGIVIPIIKLNFKLRLTLNKVS